MPPAVGPTLTISNTWPSEDPAVLPENRGAGPPDAGLPALLLLGPSRPAKLVPSVATCLDSRVQFAQFDLGVGGGEAPLHRI